VVPVLFNITLHCTGSFGDENCARTSHAILSRANNRRGQTVAFFVKNQQVLCTSVSWEPVIGGRVVKLHLGE
jgi:hypothetical protein